MDIVERLRTGPNNKHDPEIWADMLQAADAIVRLREENQNLVELLDACSKKRRRDKIIHGE